MGPVLSHSLRIALAFYATQVKLCVPFKTYSPHNKRAAIKIWFAVIAACLLQPHKVQVQATQGFSGGV